MKNDALPPGHLVCPTCYGAGSVSLGVAIPASLEAPSEHDERTCGDCRGAGSVFSAEEAAIWTERASDRIVRDALMFANRGAWFAHVQLADGRIVRVGAAMTLTIPVPSPEGPPSAPRPAPLAPVMRRKTRGLRLTAAQRRRVRELMIDEGNTRAEATAWVKAFEPSEAAQ